jgi:hypothetical protein
MSTFYGELAPWWPILSPVDEYHAEGEMIASALRAAAPHARTLLELGSGGGHVAATLKRSYACTLTDLSPAMLAVSAALNPECEHIAGDMRSIRLHRRFDLVFAHDALDYLRTEDDLRATFMTAWEHLEPGGLALFLPDHVAERFAPSTDAGGSDAPDGRGARYLEWTEPACGDRATTHYSFVLRHADGTVFTRYERPDFGLFPLATWLRVMTEVGFHASWVDEAPLEDHEPRVVLLGRKA